MSLRFFLFVIALAAVLLGAKSQELVTSKHRHHATDDLSFEFISPDDGEIYVGNFTVEVMFVPVGANPGSGAHIKATDPNGERTTIFTVEEKLKADEAVRFSWLVPAGATPGEWKLQVHTSDGPCGEPRKFKVVAAPLPPSALKAVEVGQTSIHISWKAPENVPSDITIDWYDVLFTSQPHVLLGDPQTVYHRADGPFAQIYNLQPGTQYSIAVRAVVCWGNGVLKLMSNFTEELVASTDSAQVVSLADPEVARVADEAVIVAQPAKVQAGIVPDIAPSVQTEQVEELKVKRSRKSSSSAMHKKAKAKNTRG